MAYTKINISGISARVQRASSAAQARLCERVLTDSAEYVPYRTGKLCSSGKVGVNSVSWTADYARECYYAERTFSKKLILRRRRDGLKPQKAQISPFGKMRLKG